MSYVAVSTIRDESKFIDNNIRSVLNQSVKPELYLVVDDGSTDGTTDKLKKASENHPEFRYLKTHNKRFPISGYNQVIAFNMGVNITTKMVDWEYLLKVDGDAVIPAKYVENLLVKLGKYPSLGMCGGQPIGENRRLSRVTDAARLIRRKCWDEIGGYDFLVFFDSHALIKAKQMGWKTRTFKDIKYRELRSSKKENPKEWFYTGIERKSNYLPLYHTVLASIKNIKSGYPPILNSLIIILTHILYQPRSHSPHLKKEIVKRIAINEVRTFLHEAIGGHPQYI